MIPKTTRSCANSRGSLGDKLLFEKELVEKVFQPIIKEFGFKK
jgi:hypothetical protein